MRVPPLHAQVALVHGRVERGAGRDDVAVACSHVHLAAHAAVRAHGPGPFVRLALLDDALVLERAGRAGIHARAARDARAVRERRSRVGDEPRLRASLPNLPRELALNIGADAGAPKARDALVHVDVDVRVRIVDERRIGHGTRALDPGAAQHHVEGLVGRRVGRRLWVLERKHTDQLVPQRVEVVGPGLDCHAVDEARGARRHRLRPPVDPHDAEAAGADGVESRVVARGGNVDAQSLQPAEDGLLAVDRVLGAVDGHPKHESSSSGKLSATPRANSASPDPCPHRLVPCNADTTPSNERSRAARTAFGEHLGERRLDFAAADPAGRALAARLVGAEGEHVVHELGDRRVLVEPDDPSVPQSAPDGVQVLERERDVEERRRDDAGQRASDDDPCELARPEPTAQILDDVPDGDAQLDLVQPRARKERIERDDLRPPALAPAERGVGIAAVADDPGDVDQRLHVVDECGATEQAPTPRIRRSDAHLRAPAFDRVQQGRLLPAQVAAFAADDLHVEGETPRPRTSGPRTPSCRALSIGTLQRPPRRSGTRGGGRCSPARPRRRGRRRPSPPARRTGRPP